MLSLIPKTLAEVVEPDEWVIFLPNISSDSFDVFKRTVGICVSIKVPSVSRLCLKEVCLLDVHLMTHKLTWPGYWSEWIYVLTNSFSFCLKPLQNTTLSFSTEYESLHYNVRTISISLYDFLHFITVTNKHDPPQI